MTVDRSRAARDAPAIEAAAPDDLENAADAFFAPPETARVDRIGLSARATARIAAGLQARAFVVDGIEQPRMQVALGGNLWLVVEQGIYGVRS